MPSLRLQAALRPRWPSLKGRWLSLKRHRWPSTGLPLPLPRTLATAALLIIGPALLLSRTARPRAEGLEQLMGSASLLQSFPATPDRPVPPLWSKRLGEPQASRLWRSQRRVWWQLWANQTEASPFLVIEAERAEAAARPDSPQSLRVGDLLVVGENATASRQLAVSLRPLQRRSRAGLPLRCLQRLQGGQAVYWSGASLGAIVGQVAPLLESFQVGCLSLALEDRALRWQGEAAAASSRLSSAASAGKPSRAQGSPADGPLLAVPPLGERLPLGADQLLDIEGASLDLLLRGLLDRPMIRDPLASRYGLDGNRLEQARRTPFRLRLRPQNSGPFQAGLELQLLGGPSPASWSQVLDRISASLQAQGLVRGKPGALSTAPGPIGAATPTTTSRGPAAGQAGAPVRPAASVAGPGSPGSAPATATSALAGPTSSGPTATGPGGSPGVGAAPITWQRPDGVTVGGWRWVADPGRAPQLLLFLGPPPPVALPIPLTGSFRPGQGQLWLRLRPQALAALGLLPQEIPALLQRSSQLWIEAEPLADGTTSEAISRLSGRLQLSR
ncbi:MAG: hypothetical protein ACO3B3_01165 [Cyanobium sp.]